jgi:hypothetical protein
VPVTIPAYTVNNGGHIRKAETRDAAYLAKNLRPEDKAEIKAASGRDPDSGISYAVALKDSWVGVHDQGPWVIWGHIATKPESATVWCLATTQISQHRSVFLRVSTSWLASLGGQFQSLNCFTDSRNKEHHRWLKLMRFKRIGDPLFFFDPNVEFHEYKR